MPCLAVFIDDIHTEENFCGYLPLEEAAVYLDWCRRGRPMFLDDDGYWHPLDSEGRYLIDVPIKDRTKGPCLHKLTKEEVTAASWGEFKSSSGNGIPEIYNNKGGKCKLYVNPYIGKVHLRKEENHIVYHVCEAKKVPLCITAGHSKGDKIGELKVRNLQDIIYNSYIFDKSGAINQSRVDYYDAEWLKLCDIRPSCNI